MIPPTQVLMPCIVLQSYYFASTNCADFFAKMARIPTNNTKMGLQWIFLNYLLSARYWQH